MLHIETGSAAHMYWGGSLMVVFISVAALLGCGRPNPTDAALGQVMQEARDDLKAPPDQRNIRTLNLTQGAQLAATGKTNEPGTDLDALIDEPQGAVSREVELEAIALAQEGEIALLAGDAASGMTKLEASMRLFPTLDALRVILPALAERGATEQIDGHCESTWAVLDDDDSRLEVMALCHHHSGVEDAQTAMPWVSAEAVRWYESTRAK